jgi:hypothetical protein
LGGARLALLGLTLPRLVFLAVGGIETLDERSEVAENRIEDPVEELL